MKVNEIKVRNFRSISDGPGMTIEMGKITVIAGANDSGKSAFLLGAYFGLMGLFGFPKGKNITYHRYIGGLNKHLRQQYQVDNNEPITVRVKITFQRADLERYLSQAVSWNIRERQFTFSEIMAIFSEIECVFDVNVDALFNEHGQVISESVGFSRWLNFEETIMNTMQRVASQGISASERHAFASDLLSNFHRQMLWANIQSQVLYIPAERYIDLSSWNSTQTFDYKDLVGFKLGVEPRELLQCIASLEAEGHDGQYAKFITLLQMLYPVDGVRIRNTALGNDVFVNQEGRSQPLSRSGTGIAQIMYICARILDTSIQVNSDSTIVVFDEPETGLHPGLQKSLVKLMNSLSELYEVQWVLGSHSPFIFSEADTLNGDRLWSIAHDGHQSSARSVDHSDAVQELYTNIGLHLPSILTAKVVIFCEGISEANFLPEALGKAGVDLKVQSIVIVPFGGIGNLKHITPGDLRMLHPNIILVLDWDSGEIESNKERERFVHSDIRVYCNEGYRSFENSFPLEAVARAFECETIPQIGIFDDFDTIRQKISDANPRNSITRKAKMAEKVSRAMTKQECEDHPLIQSICTWISEWKK